MQQTNQLTNPKLAEINKLNSTSRNRIEQEEKYFRGRYDTSISLGLPIAQLCFTLLKSRCMQAVKNLPRS